MLIDAVTKRVYEEELNPWLSSKIIDCHAHVVLSEHCGPVAPDRYIAIWAMEVANQLSWEELRDTYASLFPNQQVQAVAFGGVYREVDIERNNEYVFDGTLDANNKSYALTVTRPEWDATLIENAMLRGFLGIKPYPDLAPICDGEPSIYDFLPKFHLAVVDKYGGIVMLHLPRKDRIGDPDNIRELLEIHEAYPNIKLIVAHIGRAFCLPTAKKGLPHFVDAKGIYFDTAANLNADVFEYALDTIGADRLLFGSDLPFMIMRGMREHVGETYYNYTDGAYSWNRNRKSSEEEAEYTYYLYEELRALICAVKRCGMRRDVMEKILYSNCANLIGAVRNG